MENNRMEFVVGYIAVWAIMGLASLFGTDEQKPAKNYQELMERPVFKCDRLGKYKD